MRFLFPAANGRTWHSEYAARILRRAEAADDRPQATGTAQRGGAGHRPGRRAVAGEAAPFAAAEPDGHCVLFLYERPCAHLRIPSAHPRAE